MIKLKLIFSFLKWFLQGSYSLSFIGEESSTCNAAYIDIEKNKLWGIPCSEIARCDAFCLRHGLFSCLLKNYLVNSIGGVHSIISYTALILSMLFVCNLLQMVSEGFVP